MVCSKEYIHIHTYAKSIHTYILTSLHPYILTSLHLYTLTSLHPYLHLHVDLDLDIDLDIDINLFPRLWYQLQLAQRIATAAQWPGPAEGASKGGFL